MVSNNNKVLVISHNVFSTTNNMGLTMSNFFRGWDKKKIAQLYFHNEIPTTDISDNYFRITDMEMLRSKYPGTEIKKSKVNYTAITTRADSRLTTKLYELGRNRKPYMYFLRNLLWKNQKWETNQLKEWIDKFDPEVIFYAAGDYIFSMNIAIRVSEERNIPLVVYFGDDYYFYNQNKYSLINWYNRKVYNKMFKKLFARLDTFISASDKMLEAYTSEFNKKGYTIMNSADRNENRVVLNNSGKITYIGNLGLDRWRSLIEIGKSVKDKGILVDVYSTEGRDSILSHMTPENGINFHGAVASEKVQEIIQLSTIVLHVESMEKSNRERTKYSVSTKIGGYLNSGVCIFAYGPSDVASMEYLAENKAAEVVTDELNLEKKLMDLLYNESKRKMYINNALKLAQEKHNFSKNLKLFNQVILSASDYN